MPMNVFTEGDEIARRRKLAEALMQQSQEAPIQGNTGLGQALAKIATAYITKRNTDKLGEEASANKDRYQGELSSALDSYMTKMNGKPGETLTDGQAANLMQNDVAPTLAEPVKADPKGAVMSAFASQFPEMKALGAAGMQGMMKQEQETFGNPVTERGPNGQLISVQYGNRGTRKPLEGAMPFEKPLVVNNQLVDPAAPPGKDFRDKYTPPGVVATGPNGQPIVGQTEQGTGKVNFAPGGGTTINTGDKGRNAFVEKLGDSKVKMLEKSYETAQAASNVLPALEQAQKDFDAGIKSGIAGNAGLVLAKAAKALGLGDVDPSIANTESFKANMARNVFSLIKNLGSGTGISNTDLQFAEKAGGGDIALDDQALIRLLSIAQQGAANTLFGHTEMLQRLQGDPQAEGNSLEPYKVPFEFQASSNLRYNERTGRMELAPPVTSRPAAPGQRNGGAESGKVMSVQEWLNGGR